MVSIWLKQPRLPRFLEQILRWYPQTRTLNALFAYAGLARTQTSLQRIIQAARLPNRRVAILGMTAMRTMTIIEQVGWKTDVVGVPCPNGDPAQHQAVTRVPGNTRTGILLNVAVFWRRKLCNLYISCFPAASMGIVSTVSLTVFTVITRMELLFLFTFFGYLGLVNMMQCNS